jgi:hypothetical protein
LKGISMTECKRCGSFAVNPNHHGRTETDDLDLCDVCYWRKRVEKISEIYKEYSSYITMTEEETQDILCRLRILLG